MRERAEGSGGTFTVLSEPGRGSIVRATLPYERTEKPLMPEPTPVIEDVDAPTERGGLFARFRR